MGDLRWYKRDPNAALAGFAVLNLEERGAYDTVLDLIYAHDGAIADDDHYLAGWMRVDVRVWRRLRKRLIELEKVYVHAGKLRNKRADREVDAAQHRVASAARAGQQSWLKRQAHSRIISDLGLTLVQRPFELSTSRKKDITSTESVAPREEVSRERQDPAEAMRVRLRKRKQWVR